MKKSILFFFLAFFAISLQAQNAKYLKAMKGQIAKLETAKSLEDYQAVANGFERIAKAEKTEWLPGYYHAYTHIMMAATLMQKDPTSIDTYLDKAQASMDEVQKIAGDNSEVYALQAYLYQARIWPSPQSRGAQYTPLCYEFCAKAAAFDPSNPRPHYLKGQNTFYMPAFWGGGPEAALPHLKKADELYAAQDNSAELQPKWGRAINSMLLKKATAAGGNPKATSSAEKTIEN